MRMATQISYAVLISILFISGYHGASIQDWTTRLTESINRVTHDINNQVQHFSKQLHVQINNDVKAALQPGLEQIHKALENLPRDAKGQIIKGSNTVIINGGDGVLRAVLSGKTTEGTSYNREIEEQYVGNYLYHSETSYNPETNTTQKIRWRLDLSNPDAEVEILKD